MIVGSFLYTRPLTVLTLLGSTELCRSVRVPWDAARLPCLAHACNNMQALCHATPVLHDFDVILVQLLALGVGPEGRGVDVVVVAAVCSGVDATAPCLVLRCLCGKR